MSGSQPGTPPDCPLEETLVIELARVVEPLDQDPEYLLEFLNDLGLTEELLDTELDRLVSLVENTVTDPLDTLRTAVLDPLAAGDPPDLEDVPDVIGAVGDILDGLRQLSQLQFQTVDAAELADRFLDALLVRYLSIHHPKAHVALNLVGAIEEDPLSEGGRIDLSKLAALPDDPGRIPQEVFGWGTEDFAPFLVCYYLHELAWAAGVPASLEQPDTYLDDAMGRTDYATDIDDPTAFFPEEELRVPVVTIERGQSLVEAGVKIVPLPGADARLPGLALVPFGILAATESFDIGDDWTFNVRVSGDVDDWGLLVRPDDAPEFAALPAPDGTAPASGNIGELFGEAALTYDGTDPQSGETTLLGTSSGSRLAVRTISASTRVEYNGDEVVLVVALPATGVLGVHPDDFDGFLGEVMPADGLFYDFDVTVGWSSKQGLFFERGGTLEVSLPQNASLGPVTLNEIYLAATPLTDGDPGVGLAGAASATIDLGPITGTVSRLGVEATISFPEDGRGEVGPVDLELGFLPPDGIGLSVDAGVVTGGGYLGYDDENERYTGLLTLQVGDLLINAVGLLTTRLPDGSDGFSLLILISGEFTPVQLGFGFTLNGLGGLLGINRSLRAEPLGAAVRAGTLDSVLFPQNPVANAQRIVSDLRSIFPPTRAVHVFGPMVKLGWGTPTLVTADLGVVLELPTFKLAILGRLAAVLPEEEAALIVLNMDVAGVLDPPGQRAAIDASLYDSRVVQYSVSGDMAMRSAWGDDPRFVLSVGGFNPRFQPPDDFPELRRVRIGIGDPGGNPSLDLKGYFALTSNTVQVGASLSLRAEAGPASVRGHLEFHALVQFDPFKFIVDFLASLGVRVSGVSLSVSVDGTLSGPAPWRVTGRVHVDLFLVEVSANIDVSLGPDPAVEAPPRARLFPKLVSEFETVENWDAQLPAGDGLVSFRAVERESDELLAHPLGEIGVRQTLLPLEFDIERFGNAVPTGHTRFSISDAGGELSLATPTTELFAPAQFADLSDAEKLDSPAFESHVAGRRLAPEGVHVGAGAVGTTLTYETTVIDRERDQWATALSDLGTFGLVERPAVVSLPAEWTDALAAKSAVATGALRETGTERFRFDPTTVPDPTAVDATVDGVGTMAAAATVADESYVVARTRTMQQVDLPTATAERMTRTEARRALSRFEADHPYATDEYQVVAARKVDKPDGGALQGAIAAETDGGRAAQFSNTPNDTQ